MAAAFTFKRSTILRCLSSRGEKPKGVSPVTMDGKWQCGGFSRTSTYHQLRPSGEQSYEQLTLDTLSNCFM